MGLGSRFFPSSLEWDASCKLSAEEVSKIDKTPDLKKAYTENLKVVQASALKREHMKKKMMGEDATPRLELEGHR